MFVERLLNPPVPTTRREHSLSPVCLPSKYHAKSLYEHRFRGLPVTTWVISGGLRAFAMYIGTFHHVRVEAGTEE